MTCQFSTSFLQSYSRFDKCVHFSQHFELGDSHLIIIGIRIFRTLKDFRPDNNDIISVYKRRRLFIHEVNFT